MKIALAFAISLATVQVSADQSLWKREGDLWAVSSRCMPAEFTGEFKEVGAAFLKLALGAADTPEIATEAQDSYQFLADLLSDEACREMGEMLRRLHHYRSKALGEILERGGPETKLTLGPVPCERLVRGKAQI